MGFIVLKKLFLSTFVASLMVITLMMTPITSFAAISNTLPIDVEVSPPPSVVEGAFESSTDISAFNEKQCFTLPQDVNVDISQTQNSFDPLTPGTIPAGMVVSSHFMHADSVGSNLNSYSTGFVEFDSDLLGVILLDNSLDATDNILGLPGTTYPTGFTNRGLELTLVQFAPDFIGVSFSLDRVTNNWEVTTDVDQIRVITTCTEQIPVGGTLIPINTTSLLLAGTQMTAAWMIPAIIAAIGIGIVIARKF